MTSNKPAVDPKQRLGVLAEILRNIRLLWRLFKDRRVPIWIKAIPILAIAYLVWPFDLLVDPILGLGQLDDLTILLLAVNLFFSLAPAAVVAEHRGTGVSVASPGDSNTVETTYRILDDNGSKGSP